MGNEEIQEVKNISVIPTVRNDVDDPTALSVSSVNPLPEKADAIAKTEKEIIEEEAVASQRGIETDEEKAAREASEAEAAEAPDDEKTPPEKKETPPDPATPPKDTVQKRIDELTKKRRDAERLADNEKAKRLELEQELEKLRAAQGQDGKPRPEDFDTEAEFLEALTDWKLDQKAQKSTKEATEGKEKEEIKKTSEELDAKFERGRKKHADFDTLVLADNLKISPVMVDTILFSDAAEDVLYYLGQHPDESAKIAALPPLRVAHELGKIEARLTAPPPRKKTTQAPDPITPVTTTAVGDKDPATMTPKEYRAWRERDKR